MSFTKMEYEMPSDRDLQAPDTWVDRGVYKVPTHLADLYDEGRATADQLNAIADLFDGVDDYEAAKASQFDESRETDPRIVEAVLRLTDLEGNSV